MFLTNSKFNTKSILSVVVLSLICFSSVNAEETHLCSYAHGDGGCNWSASANAAKESGGLLHAYRDSNGVYQVIADSEVPVKKSVPTHVISAPGAITFNVTYQDIISNNNIGFDDPAEGATRVATMNAVLAYINTVLDHTGNCDINVLTSQSDGTGFLASAGPFYSFFATETFIEGNAFKHITTGSDPSGAVVDIQVTVDYGYIWNSNHTVSPTGGQFDLYSVLLHEVTHGLDILSLTNSSGISSLGSGNPLSHFDDELFTVAGTKIWDASENPAANISQILTGQSGGGVEFRGTNVASFVGGTGEAIF